MPGICRQGERAGQRCDRHLAGRAGRRQGGGRTLVAPGLPKAIAATAHKLARLIYAMLKHGEEYVALSLGATGRGTRDALTAAARCFGRPGQGVVGVSPQGNHWLRTGP
jgi:hypothetical protein